MFVFTHGVAGCGGLSILGIGRDAGISFPKARERPEIFPRVGRPGHAFEKKRAGVRRTGNAFVVFPQQLVPWKESWHAHCKCTRHAAEKIRRKKTSKNK